MNTLPTVSRACARQEMAFRPIRTAYQGITQTQRQCQHRHFRPITTSTTSIPSSDAVQDVLASQISSNSPQSTLQTTSTPEPQILTSRPRPRTTRSSTSPKVLTGTVTRTGTMQSCIQLTYQSQKYDAHLQKHYTRPNRLLVHDPNPAGYLREGDVVEYSGWSAEEKQARLTRKAEIEAAKMQQEQEEKERQSRPELAEENEKVTDPSSKTSKSKSVVTAVRKRRFMTGSKTKGNHGTGEEKWVGPRYVVRRVVTPFGTALDQRTREIAEKATTGDDVVKVSLKSKRANMGRVVASTKIAG